MYVYTSGFVVNGLGAIYDGVLCNESVHTCGSTMTYGGIGKKDP